MSAHFAASTFDITLKLSQGDARLVTVRWQREELALAEGVKPDRVLAAGEVMLLHELPEHSLVLVWGTV